MGEQKDTCAYVSKGRKKDTCADVSNGWTKRYICLCK